VDCIGIVDGLGMQSAWVPYGLQSMYIDSIRILSRYFMMMQSRFRMDCKWILYVYIIILWRFYQDYPGSS